jgi:beta-glucosidase
MNVELSELRKSQMTNNRKLNINKHNVMQKKVFLTVILVFIILFSGWSQKKATSHQSDSKYYQAMGASAKVASLMIKMTIDEKIGQLNLITPGGTVTGEIVSKDVESKMKSGQIGGIFGIRGAAKVRQAQEMTVKNSRLGIPLIVGIDVIHGHQTIFPIPLGMSCTWDMEMIEKSARIAAREATADGLMWTFSPMVDIARDPRWGRIAEGSGEDPFLGSKIAEAMVKGYQGKDLSDPTTMMACVKHFALYGASEGGRDYNTVDMSKIRMFNEYLPPYQAAVNAGVGSVMTSFNVIDYVPASGNKFLFTDLLRKKWKFDGLAVTDYTSVMEMMEHGQGDFQEVSQLALKANVDMEMVGEGFLTTLKKSLTEGKIKQKDIDQACVRILTAKEKLGILDDPYKYFNEERAKTEMMSSENRAFARKAAAASFVLLKNENSILPLKKDAKIALVGPLADSRRNMLGTWSVSGDHEKAVTVIEGIKSLSSNQKNVLYAKGANISDDIDLAKRVNVFGEEIVIDSRSADEMIREAVEVAQKSDIIVAVMGEAADMSGESSSMTNISLQPSQKKLLTALKAIGKPIIMILYNGRPMVIADEMRDMTAVLDVWCGGTEGGNAVADVLFGDVNPGGKLTTSFPVNVGQIPVYHSILNTGRPNLVGNPKFRTNYLDAPNEPLLPFGFGLSYTSFEYGKPLLSAPKLSRGKNISISVNVKNTGQVAGHEVVQMYIRDVVGSISRPVKELKGFERIYLLPGESKDVIFTIDENILKFYNEALEYKAEKGEFRVMVGTNSVDLQTLSFYLE